MSLGVNRILGPTVNKIGKAVDKPFSKVLSWTAGKKCMENLGHQYHIDNTKLITGISIASIVLKDGLGCYLYVKQSLNNDKIPEDKRKFVAALDLTNGGLMIAIQILMAVTISHKKVQEKLFNKFFGKYFQRSAQKGMRTILQNKENLKGLTGKQFHTALDKYQKDMLGAFAHITSIVGATMLGKRVIVPFIATPLADKAKAYMSKNDKPVEVNKNTKNTYNADISAADNAKIEAIHSTNLIEQYKAIHQLK